MKNKRSKELLCVAVAVASVLLTVLCAAKLAGHLLPQLPGSQWKNETAVQRGKCFRTQRRGKVRHEHD